MLAYLSLTVFSIIRIWGRQTPQQTQWPRCWVIAQSQCYITRRRTNSLSLSLSLSLKPTSNQSIYMLSYFSVHILKPDLDAQLALLKCRNTSLSIEVHQLWGWVNTDADRSLYNHSITTPSCVIVHVYRTELMYENQPATVAPHPAVFTVRLRSIRTVLLSTTVRPSVRLSNACIVTKRDNCL